MPSPRACPPDSTQEPGSTWSKPFARPVGPMKCWCFAAAFWRTYLFKHGECSRTPVWNQLQRISDGFFGFSLKIGPHTMVYLVQESKWWLQIASHSADSSLLLYLVSYECGTFDAQESSSTAMEFASCSRVRSAGGSTKLVKKFFIACCRLSAAAALWQGAKKRSWRFGRLAPIIISAVEMEMRSPKNSKDIWSSLIFGTVPRPLIFVDLSSQPRNPMIRACLKIGLPNSHGSWSMAISGRYLPYIRPIYWRIYDHVHNEIATFRIHPSFRQTTPIWLCFQSISILCSSMVNARKWHRNPNHSFFQKSDFSIAMNCHELPWTAMFAEG